MELTAPGWAAAAALLLAFIAAVLAGLALRRHRLPQAAADGGWRSEMEERLAACAREMAQLREELAGLRAERGVPPRYDEAMALARSGLDAEGIAARCGISVGEAELLRSLATRSSPTGG